jgi:hypothetical protein
LNEYHFSQRKKYIFGLQQSPAIWLVISYCPIVGVLIITSLPLVAWGVCRKVLGFCVVSSLIIISLSCVLHYHKALIAWPSSNTKRFQCNPCWLPEYEVCLKFRGSHSRSWLSFSGAESGFMYRLNLTHSPSKISVFFSWPLLSFWTKRINWN